MVAVICVRCGEQHSKAIRWFRDHTKLICNGCGCAILLQNEQLQAPGAPGAPAATAAQGTATASGTPATGKAMTQAEVEGMIRKIADSQSEKLDWQKSIVDLMKLLKLDSGLSARKQLAQELGYKGSLDGSADMNIWLHKQVMVKLAESGGVVPESLKHA